MTKRLTKDKKALLIYEIKANYEIVDRAYEKIESARHDIAILDQTLKHIEYVLKGESPE